MSVTDDVNSARTQAAEQFAIYGTLPSYRAMLDREGHPGSQDAALIGDERAVSERIDEFRSAGIDPWISPAISFVRSEVARRKGIAKAGRLVSTRGVGEGGR